MAEKVEIRGKLVGLNIEMGTVTIELPCLLPYTVEPGGRILKSLLGEVCYLTLANNTVLDISKI